MLYDVHLLPVIATVRINADSLEQAKERVMKAVDGAKIDLSGSEWIRLSAQPVAMPMKGMTKPI